MPLFNSPISTDKAGQVISIMHLSRGDRVLDAGCGTGEFLIRLVEATGAIGLGIDSDEKSISVARTNAAGRISDHLHEFRQSDINDESLERASFDLAICIGSTHAFGTADAAYPRALDSLTRLIRPGGQLLIGEGYWKQPPPKQYLDLIGEPVGIYRDHAENISFAEQRGLAALYATTSNNDEWDHFELSHSMRIEQEAAQHMDDPSQIQKLQRSRKWRDGYLRWGRTTMGFGVYLFQKPLDPT